MGLIWWILPAIAGFIGLMLLFAGIGKFVKLKPFSGASRLLFGTGFGVAAFLIAAVGLNLQTYKRLTFERPVADVSFEAIENAPGAFNATLKFYPGGDEREVVVTGEEFVLGARVITFKPISNMLGYDSVYRLDYFEGRNARRYNSRSVTTSEANGIALFENPGFDVAALAREHGGQFGLRDANFGSAVYNPMADGLKYEVSLTRTGLIARAANDATRRAIGEAVPTSGKPDAADPADDTPEADAPADQTELEN